MTYTRIICDKIGHAQTGSQAASLSMNFDWPSAKLRTEERVQDAQMKIQTVETDGTKSTIQIMQSQHMEQATKPLHTCKYRDSVSVEGNNSPTSYRRIAA
mmetsp:Transcript_32609/g.47224  ORF Transcript_32609/g.47224 Transcript_32609/m.47224 type:complete len:100 (-) Transcript_32609:62-361(-)